MGDPEEWAPQICLRLRVSYGDLFSTIAVGAPGELRALTWGGQHYRNGRHARSGSESPAGHSSNKGAEMAIKTISIDGVDYVRADQVSIASTDTQIVVGQRGWIFVGQVSDDGEDLVITHARNIRIWGTTKGLGELADGPTEKTKADSYGTVRLPKLTVVARINVTAGAWA